MTYLNLVTFILLYHFLVIWPAGNPYKLKILDAQIERALGLLSYQIGYITHMFYLIYHPEEVHQVCQTITSCTYSFVQNQNRKLAVFALLSQSDEPPDWREMTYSLPDEVLLDLFPVFDVVSGLCLRQRKQQKGGLDQNRSGRGGETRGSRLAFSI